MSKESVIAGNLLGGYVFAGTVAMHFSLGYCFAELRDTATRLADLSRAANETILGHGYSG